MSRACPDVKPSAGIAVSGLIALGFSIQRTRLSLELARTPAIIARSLNPDRDGPTLPRGPRIPGISWQAAQPVAIMIWRPLSGLPPPVTATAESIAFCLSAPPSFIKRNQRETARAAMANDIRGSKKRVAL